MANSKKKSSSENSKKSRTKKSKSRISSSNLSPTLLQHLGILPEEFEALKAFNALRPQERVKESRKIIQECIINATSYPDSRFSIAITESETLLKGYSTLDEPHRIEIQRLIKNISLYLKDSTRKRPFNALMLAAPGAGKSHFIKQLANSMKEEQVQAVTFNMATMQSADDIAQPIDELRNLKVNDRFPLLFLDEFDSDPSRYAALLPLLWDGELQIGHRDLKLGKSVIVLAGSNPNLPKVMDHSAKMGLEKDSIDGFIPPGKLIDLLSRINGGVINIPDLDLRSENRDRRVDKVCIAVALLIARFGNSLNQVPRSLLRFIAQTLFRYGVRSIAHLIDLIGNDAFRNGVLKGNALGLPFINEELLQNSSLKLHLLDKDQGFGIVNRWKELSRDKATVRIKDHNSRFFRSLF